MNYDFYDLYAGDPESQQTQIEVRYNVENYFVSSVNLLRVTKLVWATSTL